ncbi:hypothetical protein Afil01_04450 [Actinorhabdospora filicis]|uniref:Uncharacterized protein n=1 Tax=Actinorhabdospora filicis TaxID=1785913 RepID=A0A9W6W764_9ACTN|nr:hypothetical protein [Actinorhabdospora filicis]GLZ75638.1 hypothetical protein Afil01_04450 [Actinorhabdospora filicis]
MGRIVRQVSDGVTKHYWYPGEKADWIKAGIAVGAGAVTFALVAIVLKDMLVAAVLGTSVTTGIGGVNLGRRDVTALQGFPDVTAARKAAVAHASRACWRGLLYGFTAAAAAVFIVNMPHTGFVADWLLPVVPAIVGAIAHQAGMVYERMGQVAPAEAEAAEDPKELEPAG